MSSLLLKGICKSYGKVEVIRNVDLQIDDGEFTVFVGPSGCGKSTLLRLVAGLADITSGDMYFSDKKVNTLHPSDRGIGMVFQSYALYPHMTVYQNMAFGLTLAKDSKETIEKRVMDAAGILQLENLLTRRPKELSGGQRQRVAIGRAIVRNPNVFLFDEPLSNLDAALRVQMRIEIAKLHERLGTTMIYVTHDQVEAMTMADKIVVLNDGRVEQVGPPLKLYHYPQNLFVAGFIGSPKMNFFSAKVDKPGDSDVEVTLDNYSVKPKVNGSRLKKGDQVTVGIRPEHVIIGEQADNVLSGKVIVVEHLGGETLVYIGIQDVMPDPFVAKITGDISIKHGSEIKFGFKNEDCHVFDQNQAALRRTTG